LRTASPNRRRSALRALLLYVSATAGCVSAAGAPPPVPARDDRAALRHAIDSMLAAPETRAARWGVLVVDAERGDTLYSHDAGRLFVPASNMKLVTGAMALDLLGADFTFATPVLARGEVRGGTLDGDVLVVGRGDPSVSDNTLGDAMIPLRAAADSLWNRGIRRVRGHLVAHGNAFPDATAGYAWSWEDLDASYGAQIDELLFNEGFSELHVRGAARAGDVPEVRTGPARTWPRVRVEARTVVRGAGRDSLPQLDAVKDTLRGDVVLTGTIPAGDSATLEVTHGDPAVAYLAALREALVDRGISVADSDVAAGTRVDTLAVLRSPPLAQLLPTFLKPSQNQVGEMLFKTFALQRTDTGTYRVARRIVAEKLRSWGAASDGFLVWDGSGLSRQDLISPGTIVRVLDTMRRRPDFQTYYDALPVAGVDGTLRGRMRGTRAEGNVRGKTGTLSSVRSLSGYVTTAGGRLLLFSVLCNNYLVPTAYVTRVQDSIAVRLSRLRDTGSGARQGN
jgi:D-alanyl-D-alanine carboxypeptidase/D-alanyl-D-alanine-endopeptidase (penicillin-binding protein 4)